MQDGIGIVTGSPRLFRCPVAGSILKTATLFPGIFAQISQRLVVMQDGQVVESGATVDVLDRPQHPYTAALRRAAAELEGAPDVKTAEVR